MVLKLLWLAPTEPITVAARSNVRMALDRSNTGIVGSNPVRGPHVYLLCSPVWVEGLRCADPPIKESYQNVLKGFTVSEVNSESEQT
jgi:hypothetical protein